jgi:hypothetical protein
MKARHHLNARNEFWSVVMRCPFPFVFLIATYRICRQLVYGALQGWAWFVDEPKWIIDAFCNIHLPLAERSSISWSIYLKWMRLARNPIKIES